MKHLISSLFVFFSLATFTGCSSDDDEIQYQHHSIKISIIDSYKLPSGTSGGTTSNPYVLSIDHNGVIRPRHVGKATVQAIGNRTKYTYQVEVEAFKDNFTDLGQFVNKSKNEVDRVLGKPQSGSGYKYIYRTRGYDDDLSEVRYNSNLIMDYAIQTFRVIFSEDITKQLLERYVVYKIDENGYTIYIDADTFDEASILLARNENEDTIRIIFMSPSTYLLLGDISNLFTE